MAFALENRSFTNCVLNVLYRVLCRRRRASRSAPTRCGAPYAIAGRVAEAIQTDLSDQQMTDLVLAVTHGLTALHIANEPNLPVGEGRFGSLISAAVSLFNGSRVWTAGVRRNANDDKPNRPKRCSRRARM